MEANQTNSPENFADAAGATDAAAPVVVPGKEFKWFFKAENLKDENGEPTGVKGRKHPDVVATLPVPSFEEAVEKALANEKVKKLFTELIEDLIFQGGRSQINAFLEANPEGTFTASNFNLDKLTIEFLSTIDKKSRGLWSPDAEDMKAFIEDYKTTMTTTVGYDAKKVGIHCKNFEKGLLKIKGDKAILTKLKDIMVLYAANSTNMEENQPTYDWLQARIERWLKVEEKVTVDAF